MRQRIDLPALYADAHEQLRVGADDAATSRPAPEACPFALDELLCVRPDLAALVAKL
jgi:hypothetical protein